MRQLGGAVYRGHDGLRSWHLDLEEAWEEIFLEPETYLDPGEHTLAFLVPHGRGRHSGAQVAMRVANVGRWRESLIVYLKGYAVREDA